MDGILDLFSCRLTQRNQLLLSAHEIGGVHAEIDTVVLAYPELEELPDARVAILPLVTGIDRLVGA